MENPSAPRGKSQKYARVERERRWLLPGAPPLAEAVAELEIVDTYFTGTRLRLRKTVDRRGGGPTIYKLTQKVPGPDGSFGLITNVYLAEAEYELLRRVGGDVLRKVRYRVPPFGIDVFEPPLRGLVLAEIEFVTDDEAARSAAAPADAVEVTDDERFTGGRLAVNGVSELCAALAAFGVQV